MKVTIIGHPNSKKPRIERDSSGTMHIYVSQPPLEGKANKAIAVALAKQFNVSKNSVTLVSGQKSKFKVFEIAKN